MKEIRDIRKAFIIAILVMIFAPFVAIPAIVMILKLLISLLSWSKVFNEIIVLKIDMKSTISVGDFINYYCTFLGIETAAYLSYRVYVLTIARYEHEDKQKSEENKNQLLLNLKSTRENIQTITKPYSENRGGAKWSFYKLLEQQQQQQFSYSDAKDEFSKRISAEEIHYIKTITDYINDSKENVLQLIGDIKVINEGLEILNKHTDIQQIEDRTVFQGYQCKIDSVLKTLDLFIEKLS